MTMPGGNPKGDCYKAAYEAVIELGDIRAAGLHVQKNWNLDGLSLVHGTVIPVNGPYAGQEIGHAWVEVDGDVLELSNENLLRVSKENWVRTFKAHEKVRYPPAIAKSFGTQSGHAGPW